MFQIINYQTFENNVRQPIIADTESGEKDHTIATAMRMSTVMSCTRNGANALNGTIAVDASLWRYLGLPILHFLAYFFCRWSSRTTYRRNQFKKRKSGVAILASR